MIKPGMFIGDRYEIIDKVGSGGMADVYKARCHKLNRFVAVKIMKPEFSDDKNFISKFRGEAQSAAGLSHPNIVNVYDVGEDEGLYFIVMELVEGITLKNFIERKGRLDIRESVGIAIQIAQGMEAAHANHIIHRDIKPQNIMISKEGKVKVADFGIAKATSSNTLTSNAMGSVHYISPEQARGGYSDEKSDIYSLGVTMYEMISGQVPFEGDSAVSIALLHIQTEAPTLGEAVPGVPISVDKIVQKCMQKKPERRYLSAGELIADLKHSILEPNVDFVVISSAINTNSPTIALSQEDLDAIRNGVVHNTDDFMEQQQLLTNYNDDYNNNYDNGYNNYDTNYNNNSYGSAYNNNGYGNGYNDNGSYNDGQNPDMQINDKYQESAEADDDLDDATLDPKIEKFAAYAAYAVVGIIVLVLVYIVVASSDSFFDKETPTVIATTAPPVTTDAPKEGEKEMVDVCGKTLDEAKDALSEENFGINVNIGLAYDTNVEKDNVGKVVKQNPIEGVSVSEGSNITLTIGAEEETKMADMPSDLAGMTKEEAIEAICKVFTSLDRNKITVEEKDNTGKEEGIVVDVLPVSGTTLEADYNEKITLYVSSGQDTITIPSDLLGKNESTVKATLEAKGLIVKNGGEKVSDTYQAGKVSEIDPIGGTEVKSGSTVTYYISSGAEEKKVYTVTVVLTENPFSDPATAAITDITEGTIKVTLKYAGSSDTSSVKASYDDIESDSIGAITFNVESLKEVTTSDITVSAVLAQNSNSVGCEVDSIEEAN